MEPTHLIIRSTGRLGPERVDGVCAARAAALAELRRRRAAETVRRSAGRLSRLATLARGGRRSAAACADC